MPQFRTTPAVFPPEVPPCGRLGDAPAFAFAVDDAVVAWTPPDGFPSKQNDSTLTFFRDDGEVLDIEVTHRRPEGTMTARDVLARELVAKHHRYREQCAHWPSDLEAPPRVTVEIDELSQPEIDEFRMNFAARLEFTKSAQNGDLVYQAAGVVVRADDATAIGLQVEDASRPRRRHPSIETIRENVRAAFAQRVSWSEGPRVYYWHHDVGLALDPDWRLQNRVADGIASGAWQAPESAGEGRNLVGWEAGIDLFTPQPLAGIDFRTAPDAELERNDSAGRRAEARAVTVPAHGHDVAHSFEVRRHVKENPRPKNWNPADHDPEDVLLWEPTPGETIRIAYIAVGRGHVVRLRLAVGDCVADRLEDWWRQAMERLHVMERAGTTTGTHDETVTGHELRIAAR